MALQYCLVGGIIGSLEIVDGPRKLPKAWKNISGLNLLSDERLKTLGWLPYINTKPSFDDDTQYLTSTKVVGEDAVTETYTVHDYTEAELAERFTAAQSAKMADLYANVKRFISTQPNGWPRYDDDLKLNIMNASMTAIAAGNDKPVNCVAVETWIYTVQTYFFGLKAAINAVETMVALQQIDVSYDHFESRYGRTGTVAADPAISTDDLFL